MPLPERPSVNPFETLNTIEVQRLNHWLSYSSFEIFPDDKALDQISNLNLAHPVSVTSSPTRPLEHTVGFSLEIAKYGVDTRPHLAARHLNNQQHLAQLALQLKSADINHIFAIAGDNPFSPGGINSSYEMLLQLQQLDLAFATVGIGGYPEGHPKITDKQLQTALLNKQDLSERHGISMYVVTQMCFDPHTIINWVENIRHQGIHLPVVVGIPGSIKLANLISFAARCGVGDSQHLLTSKFGLATSLGRQALTGFDPSELLLQLAQLTTDDHRIAGVEFYTFNAIAKTQTWINQAMSDLNGQTK